MVKEKENIKNCKYPILEIYDETVKEAYEAESNKTEEFVKNIKDFLYNDCKCKGEWNMAQFTKNTITILHDSCPLYVSIPSCDAFLIVAD